MRQMLSTSESYFLKQKQTIENKVTLSVKLHTAHKATCLTQETTMQTGAHIGASINDVIKCMEKCTRRSLIKVLRRKWRITH